MENQHDKIQGGLPLKCLKCGHKWTYKGKKNVKTNCPDCRNLVQIKRD